MRTSRWRLAMMVGALVILGAIGGGLVQAASASPAPASTEPAPALPAATSAETAADLPPLPAERLRAFRDRLRDGGLRRLGEHLVHGTITVVGRDGELVTRQLDHGTISDINDGSIVIAEAGGSSVTVATTADTRVRTNGEPATLSALAVGDEVFVVSEVSAGAATARWIVVRMPEPETEPSGEGS